MKTQRPDDQRFRLNLLRLRLNNIMFLICLFDHGVNTVSAGVDNLLDTTVWTTPRNRYLPLRSIMVSWASEIPQPLIYQYSAAEIDRVRQCGLVQSLAKVWKITLMVQTV